MGLQISVRECGDVNILDLRGRSTIREGESELLGSHLKKLIDKGARKLLLNLSDLAQIDSSGIGVIVATCIALRRMGGDLKLLCPSGRVLDVLTVVRLLDVIPSFENEAQALASFKPGGYFATSQKAKIDFPNLPVEDTESSLASPCNTDTAQKIALVVPSGAKWTHAHHYLTQSGEADACHARCVCVGTTVQVAENPKTKPAVEKTPWGAHEHPSLMNPDQGAPGNGLLLFFCVDDFDLALQRARSLVTRLEQEPDVNPNTQTKEFSLRDPDGYYVTINALSAA